MSLKILTIADLHGRKPFPAKKLIKKYNPDILICTGDLAYSDKIRKIIFSHWGENIPELLGKQKYLAMHSEAIKSASVVLRYLNSLGKPVYLIYGNNDYTSKEIKNLGLKLKGLEKNVKKYKNIKLLTASKKKIKGYSLIGVSGYRTLNTITESKKQNTKLLKKFKKLFSKTRKDKTIFLYHDVPFRTKFDLVRNRQSPMNRKHIGDSYINKIIKQYKPLLYICGHMHENPGVIKLYKTICLNTGLVQNKDYFIINIKDRKVSIKRVK